MSAQWIAVIGSSAICYGIKYAGSAIPESWLSNPRIQRINALIPIVLLTALVAVNTLSTKTKLRIDHRAAGVAVAIAALIAKAPFPVVVVGAAITSAVLYHFNY
jgi:branched-subunit amino acid transport protein